MNLRSVPTFASGLAATAAVIVASVRTRAGTPSARRIEPVVRTWARAWLIPAGVRLEVEGPRHVSPGQRYVVVSNHLSNLDSMVLLAGLGLPLRFLAMRELFDVPLLGSALRRLGMIEVDRDNPHSAMIAQGVSQAMADGASVVVFPEGQTSHDGSLNRFRIVPFPLRSSKKSPSCLSHSLVREKYGHLVTMQFTAALSDSSFTKPSRLKVSPSRTLLLCESSRVPPSLQPNAHLFEAEAGSADTTWAHACRR